ncbi:MAG: hypothetical protein AMXMBFR58_03900 [Phycisphaerae bacterium]
MAQEQDQIQTPVPAGERPPRRMSKLVVIAVIAMLFGAGSWVYAAVTRPDTAGGTPPAGTSPAAMSMTDPTSGAPAGSTSPSERRLIDDGAPALFRFGASFLAAYFLAWGLKKFVKLTLLVAGAVAAVIIGLQRFGIIGVEGDQIREGAERGAHWVAEQGGAVRALVMGYLPSGIAGAVGAYKGLRA